MKKFIVLQKSIALLILCFVSTVLGQFKTQDLVRHGKQTSVSFTIQSTGYDSLLFQFAGSVNKEPKLTEIDTAETIATHWITNKGNIVWSGYLRIQIDITNTDLVTDSLEVLVYGLDVNGNIISNDAFYSDFTTPPSYNVAVQTLDWTSAVKYVSQFYGAFGEGVAGILIILDINDETEAHTGVGNLKVTGH